MLIRPGMMAAMMGGMMGALADPTPAYEAVINKMKDDVEKVKAQDPDKIKEFIEVSDTDGDGKVKPRAVVSALTEYCWCRSSAESLKRAQ